MCPLRDRPEKPECLLRDHRVFTAASQPPRGLRQGAGCTLGLMNDNRSERSSVLDIAIPVYNEERILDHSVRTLHAYARNHLPFATRITIVDNASQDATRAIGAELAAALDGVSCVHLPEKGRGRALRAAWMASDARVLAYMDVDLSTRLEALPALTVPIAAGSTDISIGSRLAPGARVTRSAQRECISRGYNLLLRGVLHTRFRDAQCGFKAIRAEVAHALLPAVRDDGWFFDTELLVLAQRAGLRILEVPVEWVEDTDSRVSIPRTAITDLRGVLRMLRAAPTAASGRQAPSIPLQELP
jgi:glycosyltransferase involved in cell wall biosynthesis